MVVRVHIDVPQAQLVQLPNDLLHGVLVLVGHAVQGAGAGGGSGYLGVGEVQQPIVAGGWNNLILLGGIQEGISAAVPAKCQQDFPPAMCQTGDVLMTVHAQPR